MARQKVGSTQILPEDAVVVLVPMISLAHTVLLVLQSELELQAVASVIETKERVALEFFEMTVFDAAEF